MALKDLFKLVDDKLADVFHQKPYDPSKGRQRFSKHLDTTASQFGSIDPVKGRKAFRVSNQVVEYKPPFAIEGKDTFYVPAERFPDFLTGLKTSCEAGELDKTLEAHHATGGAQSRPTGQKRAGWSPERRAAFEAAQAAKKSGK